MSYVSVLSPVRILVNYPMPEGSYRIPETVWPYQFRDIVQGHFGHKHLEDGPYGLVIGFREPSSIASADMQREVTYPTYPAPYFYVRSCPDGGFCSLSDSDMQHLGASVL